MKRVKRTIRIDVETERAFVVNLRRDCQTSSDWLSNEAEAAPVTIVETTDLLLQTTEGTDDRTVGTIDNQSGRNVRKEEDQ